MGEYRLREVAEIPRSRRGGYGRRSSVRDKLDQFMASDLRRVIVTNSSVKPESISTQFRKFVKDGKYPVRVIQVQTPGRLEVYLEKLDEVPANATALCEPNIQSHDKARVI